MVSKMFNKLQLKKAREKGKGTIHLTFILIGDVIETSRPTMQKIK